MHIEIIGGGRWARVHLAVLHQILSPQDKISWITSHNFEDNRRWLADKGIHNVSLGKTPLYENIDGIIIATASHTHAAFLKQALDNKIPCLCEKPFALSYSEAVAIHALSKNNNVPAAMNIEFISASYLQDFADAISGETIKNIHIEWHDPLFEMRDDVLKISDIYTPIAFDHLIHCWSILYRLLGIFDLELIDTKYNLGQNIEIHLRTSTIDICFSLSRHSSHRTRKISVNGGDILMDFSCEPGSIIKDNVVTNNQWHGPSPMTATLVKFIDQIQSPNIEKWPEYLGNMLPLMKLSDEVNRALCFEMKNEIDNIKTMNEEDQVVLALDYFGPQLAEDNIRVDFSTSEERKKALALIFNRYLSY